MSPWSTHVAQIQDFLTPRPYAIRQAHLQHNPLLHDVFGFSPRTERPERLTAAEKRLTRSCHSAEARARAASRQYSRDAKAYLTTGYHD